MDKLSLSFQFSAAEAWQAQLADCRGARESIYLEQYIFVDDVVGKSFLAVLKDKAEQGLDVRLLLDMFGSVSLYLDLRRIEEIKSWGVKLEFFNPIALWRLDSLFLFQWFSRRDHRKLLLVDGKVAHLGSANVGEYMRAWREANVRLAGATLEGLRESFNRLWVASKPDKLSRKVSNAYLGKGLSYLASTPRVRHRIVHKQLLRAVRRARESVVLVSPYLVPTERLMRSISRALRRGVRVKIILPEHCDSKIVDIASHSYARSLGKRGAQIYFYPSMLHSKYFIVDGEWAMMGSANLDNLSLLNDYEHEVVGTNEGLVTGLEKNATELMDMSKLLDTNKQASTFKERFLGVIVRPLHRFL